MKRDVKYGKKVYLSDSNCSGLNTNNLFKTFDLELLYTESDVNIIWLSNEVYM